MISKKQLQALAVKHGTPLFVVDHEEIRRNYAQFKKYLPRVQAYYAVKAEPLPEIVKTLFDAGASFDVASMPEFLIVHENIKNMPDKKRLDWIWDKIIYANPIKPNETLKQLDPYRPLVTYDNIEEVHKIKKYAPHAGLVLRIRVANTGAVVELSSKFGAAAGEAVDLILAAEKLGLGVEGLSFHVGSQTTNFENFVQAISRASDIFKEAKERGHTRMNLLDIGGGFPAPYDASVKPFQVLAKKINAEINRLFPPHIEILAEPGRFMIATAGTSVVKINGKAVRDGKTCYYVDDGAYHTYSGIIFDHQHCHMKSFRKGREEICGVFGPTCDALDVISMSENLPSDLKLGELLYSENMGAYSHASSTSFNGFPPAKVVHANLKKPASAKKK
ncbi:MAG: type III PLP-dependent enzyme [Elusimicrobia bacterium CG_4_10_14_0_2_um_filter_56_8]|nr:MAG: decarboxylase [Elusimicrobia bacterium CG1_02_56_21]PJA16055.1 MAG: type III PLP-dependent enzyme [Elusimicrobia bacterium CG_4_10_14_0_2_um_filter_56_8]